MILENAVFCAVLSPAHLKKKSKPELKQPNETLK